MRGQTSGRNGKHRARACLGLAATVWLLQASVSAAVDPPPPAPPPAALSPPSPNPMVPAPAPPASAPAAPVPPAPVPPIDAPLIVVPDLPAGPPDTGPGQRPLPPPNASDPALPSGPSSLGGVGGAGGLGGFGGGPGGAGMYLSPRVGQLQPLVGYRAAEFFSAPVRNQDAHLSYLQQNVSILAPVWQTRCDEVAFTANVGVESFNTSAILPDTRQPFPSDLWNVRFGANYRHLFENGWIAGGSFSVGSAGDKPFQGFNETTFSVNGFLRVPQGERNAWIFSLSLSSNSQVLPYIPIPGIAYLWVPSDTFQALIGFPFANITWRPAEDWTIQLTYALLTTFHGRVSYRLAPPVRLYAGIDIENQNYFLANRPSANDRFFVYDDRISAGTQIFLSRGAFLDFSAGYVFDRSFSEGTSGTQRNFNRVEVGNGAFIGASFQLRY